MRTKTQSDAAPAPRDYLADRLARESARMRAAISEYEAFHKDRFEYVVKKCREMCPDVSANVLDVGRSYLTLELLTYYDNVSTLGFPLERESFTGIDRPDGSRKCLKTHLAYNLNQAQTQAPIVCEEKFDLIVFAEVIEHLYTAPELTLLALKCLMKPGGHMIVQTPNATALHKRLLLLIGRHPYEEIRADVGNPGHFREYTKAELVKYAREIELDMVQHEYKDYFGRQSAPRLLFRLYKGAVALVPSFARGQTLILRCGS